MSSRYGRNQRRRHREQIAALEERVTVLQMHRRRAMHELARERGEKMEAINAPLNRLTKESEQYLGELLAGGIAKIHDRKMRELVAELSKYKLARVHLEPRPARIDQTQVITIVMAETKHHVLITPEMQKAPADPARAP